MTPAEHFEQALLLVIAGWCAAFGALLLVLYATGKL